MFKDLEMKTIAEMADMMSKIIHENDINPMQGMTLVGYAARQVVANIGNSMNLSPQQSVIIALGSMLPNGYVQEMLCGNNRPCDHAVK